MADLLVRRCVRALILVMLAASGMVINVDTVAQNRSALTFELPASPAAHRHLAMLEYPAYLALAIENAGVPLTRSTGIQILDANSLRYKTATLRFVKRSGAIYFYEASIDWDIGMVQTSFSLPIEADISEFDKGKVTVRLFLAVANLLPQDLIERIRAKVQSLSDASLQQRVLEYLDALQKDHAPGDMDSVLNEILVQAYNRQAAKGGSAALREPGDAEPLSDQVLLLVTLFIWLIVVPLVALGRYVWRRVRVQKPAR